MPSCTIINGLEINECRQPQRLNKPFGNGHIIGNDVGSKEAGFYEILMDWKLVLPFADIDRLCIIHFPEYYEELQNGLREAARIMYLSSQITPFDDLIHRMNFGRNIEMPKLPDVGFNPFDYHKLIIDKCMPILKGTEINSNVLGSAFKIESFESMDINTLDVTFNLIENHK